MTFDDDKAGRHEPPGNRDLANANSQNSPFRCSLCGKAFDRLKSKCVPFCSTRCQQIDLGNWLNEDYGFPVESGEVPEESDDD